MTQPKTTAKKTSKTTEAKMAALVNGGGAILAAGAKKAKRKTATRKKTPAKKGAAKAKASPKRKTTPTTKKTPKTDAPKQIATPKQEPKQEAPKTRRPRAPRGQDPRIPPVGSTIERVYKGETVKLIVVEGGFRWGKREFTSLSAAAKAITGTKSTINGILWFRLTDLAGDPTAD